MSRYAKTIVALVGVLTTWALGEWPDSEDVKRYASLASALATFVGVYFVPNKPPVGKPADPAISEQG